jgi:hypothetical protein
LIVPFAKRAFLCRTSIFFSPLSFELPADTTDTELPATTDPAFRSFRCPPNLAALAVSPDGSSACPSDCKVTAASDDHLPHARKRDVRQLNRHLATHQTVVNPLVIGTLTTRTYALLRLTSLSIAQENGTL